MACRVDVPPDDGCVGLSDAAALFRGRLVGVGVGWLGGVGWLSVGVEWLGGCGMSVGREGCVLIAPMGCDVLVPPAGCWADVGCGPPRVGAVVAGVAANVAQ